MPGAKKGTAVATRKRAPTPDQIHDVLTLIVNGHTEHFVREQIAARFPSQDAQPLIVSAMAQLEKSGQFEPGFVRGWCFEAYRELYRRARKAKDFASALRAVKQIEDMVAKG